MCIRDSPYIGNICYSFRCTKLLLPIPLLSFLSVSLSFHPSQFIQLMYTVKFCLKSLKECVCISVHIHNAFQLISVLNHYKLSLFLQNISGIRLLDTFLKRTYDYDELAQVYITQKAAAIA